MSGNIVSFNIVYCWSEKLTFQNEQYTHERRNRRQPNNPPFSRNVKTNIAKLNLTRKTTSKKKIDVTSVGKL